MKSQAEKIQDINSVGWDGVDANVTPLRLRNTDMQRAVDVAFRKTFMTEDGQKVLEHLRSVTVEQPAWVPGADPSYGYAREGQNSIVREIEQRIRRANEPE
jgi:hypothetical protein